MTKSIGLCWCVVLMYYYYQTLFFFLSVWQIQVIGPCFMNIIFFFSGEKEKVSRGTCGDSGPDQGHARAGGRGEKLISAVSPRYTYMLTFHATEKQNKADFF